MSIEAVLKTRLGQSSVVTCESSTSIHEVARMMDHKNVGCVVITNEQGIPEGIVTDRDILLRVIAKEPVLSSADPVRLVMSTPLRTLSLFEGLHDAIRIMKEAKVRRLPVINALGVVVGILTFSDLYSLLSHEISDLQSILTAESGFEFGKLVA